MTRILNRDDLILGGYANIVVVSWTGESFVPKCLIRGVSEGIIRDLCVANSRIFSVSKEDDFVGETFFQY